MLKVLRVVYGVCVVTISLHFVDTSLGIIRRVCGQGRSLGGGPLGNFVRLLRMTIFFVNFVLVVDVLVNGSPAALFTKLNTSTTVLVLIFGSALLKFMTNVRLSTGSVLHPNS